ncbi:hypothetical protein TWF696_008053 [Orbilia brochopaga]|uniref:Secreted protein n=1 Tax=Orbilia brochopaga TaxID=3140254 RepID=A0AAV9UMD2_9PEZI
MLAVIAVLSTDGAVTTSATAAVAANRPSRLLVPAAPSLALLSMGDAAQDLAPPVTGGNLMGNVALNLVTAEIRLPTAGRAAKLDGAAA